MVQLWTQSEEPQAAVEDRWRAQSFQFGGTPFDILCAVWLNQTMIVGSTKKGEICLFDIIKRMSTPPTSPCPCLSRWLPLWAAQRRRAFVPQHIRLLWNSCRLVSTAPTPSALRASSEAPTPKLPVFALLVRDGLLHSAGADGVIRTCAEICTPMVNITFASLKRTAARHSAVLNLAVTRARQSDRRLRSAVRPPLYAVERS